METTTETLQILSKWFSVKTLYTISDIIVYFLTVGAAPFFYYYFKTPKYQASIRQKDE